MTALKLNNCFFKKVVHNFFGNKKDARYTEYVDNMLEKFDALSCNMSLNQFPEDLEAVSEEQCERFHQDIKKI